MQGELILPALPLKAPVLALQALLGRTGAKLSWVR